jgi:hypothetical protein
LEFYTASIYTSNFKIAFGQALLHETDIKYVMIKSLHHTSKINFILALFHALGKSNSINQIFDSQEDHKRNNSNRTVNSNNL